MSYSQAREGIITAISKVTPQWDSDRSFVSLESAYTGSAPDLESIPDAVDRFFDVRLVSGPDSTGESGYCYESWVASCELRIRYSMEGDRGRLDAMVASDVPRVIHALEQPQHFIPGVTDSVAAQQRRPEPTVLRREDKEFAMIIRIPFLLYFTEDLSDIIYPT